MVSSLSTRKTGIVPCRGATGNTPDLSSPGSRRQSRRIACGIFGSQSLGGVGGVSLGAQVVGTLLGVSWALIAGVIVYGGLKAVTSLRLTLEEEYEGADLSIHRIGATPEREANW